MIPRAFILRLAAAVLLFTPVVISAAGDSAAYKKTWWYRHLHRGDKVSENPEKAHEPETSTVSPPAEPNRFQRGLPRPDRQIREGGDVEKVQTNSPHAKTQTTELQDSPPPSSAPAGHSWFQQIFTRPDPSSENPKAPATGVLQQREPTASSGTPAAAPSTAGKTVESENAGRFSRFFRRDNAAPPTSGSKGATPRPEARERGFNFSEHPPLESPSEPAQEKRPPPRELENRIEKLRDDRRQVPAPTSPRELRKTHEPFRPIQLSPPEPNSIGPRASSTRPEKKAARSSFRWLRQLFTHREHQPPSSSQPSHHAESIEHTAPASLPLSPVARSIQPADTRKPDASPAAKTVVRTIPDTSAASLRESRQLKRFSPEVIEHSTHLTLDRPEKESAAKPLLNSWLDRLRHRPAALPETKKTSTPRTVLHHRQQPKPSVDILQTRAETGDSRGKFIPWWLPEYWKRPQPARTPDSARIVVAAAPTDPTAAVDRQSAPPGSAPVSVQSVVPKEPEVSKTHPFDPAAEDPATPVTVSKPVGQRVWWPILKRPSDLHTSTENRRKDREAHEQLQGVTSIANLESTDMDVAPKDLNSESTRDGKISRWWHSLFTQPAVTADLRGHTRRMSGLTSEVPQASTAIANIEPEDLALPPRESLVSETAQPHPVSRWWRSLRERPPVSSKADVPASEKPSPLLAPSPSAIAVLKRPQASISPTSDLVTPPRRLQRLQGDLPENPTTISTDAGLLEIARRRQPASITRKDSPRHTWWTLLWRRPDTVVPDKVKRGNREDLADSPLSDTTFSKVQEALAATRRDLDEGDRGILLDSPIPQTKYLTQRWALLIQELKEKMPKALSGARRQEQRPSDLPTGPSTLLALENSVKPIVQPQQVSSRQPVVGIFEKPEGSVRTSPPDQPIHEAAEKTELRLYDKLFTGEKSSVSLQFPNIGKLEVGADSSLQVVHFDEKLKYIEILLLRGRIRARLDHGKLMACTPTSNVVLRRGYGDIIITAFNTLVAPRSGAAAEVSSSRSRKYIAPGRYGLVTVDGYLIISDPASDAKNAAPATLREQRTAPTQAVQENPALAYLPDELSTSTGPRRPQARDKHLPERSGPPLREMRRVADIMELVPLILEDQDGYDQPYRRLLGEWLASIRSGPTDITRLEGLDSRGPRKAEVPTQHTPTPFQLPPTLRLEPDELDPAQKLAWLSQTLRRGKISPPARPGKRSRAYEEFELKGRRAEMALVPTDVLLDESGETTLQNYSLADWWNTLHHRPTRMPARDVRQKDLPLNPVDFTYPEEELVDAGIRTPQLAQRLDGLTPEVDSEKRAPLIARRGQDALQETRIDTDLQPEMDRHDLRQAGSGLSPLGPQDGADTVLSRPAPSGISTAPTSQRRSALAETITPTPFQIPLGNFTDMPTGEDTVVTFKENALIASLKQFFSRALTRPEFIQVAGNRRAEEPFWETLITGDSAEATDSRRHIVVREPRDESEDRLPIWDVPPTSEALLVTAVAKATDHVEPARGRRADEPFSETVVLVDDALEPPPTAERIARPALKAAPEKSEATPLVAEMRRADEPFSETLVLLDDTPEPPPTAPVIAKPTDKAATEKSVATPLVAGMRRADEPFSETVVLVDDALEPPPTAERIARPALKAAPEKSEATPLVAEMRRADEPFSETLVLLDDTPEPPPTAPVIAKPIGKAATEKSVATPLVAGMRRADEPFIETIFLTDDSLEPPPTEERIARPAVRAAPEKSDKLTPMAEMRRVEEPFSEPVVLTDNTPELPPVTGEFIRRVLNAEHKKSADLSLLAEIRRAEEPFRETLILTDRTPDPAREPESPLTLSKWVREQRDKFPSLAKQRREPEDMSPTPIILHDHASDDLVEFPEAWISANHVPSLRQWRKRPEFFQPVPLNLKLARDEYRQQTRRMEVASSEPRGPSLRDKLKKWLSPSALATTRRKVGEDELAPVPLTYPEGESSEPVMARSESRPAPITSPETSDSEPRALPHAAPETSTEPPPREVATASPSTGSGNLEQSPTAMQGVKDWLKGLRHRSAHEKRADSKPHLAVQEEKIAAPDSPENVKTPAETHINFAEFFASLRPAERPGERRAEEITGETIFTFPYQDQKDRDQPDIARWFRLNRIPAAPVDGTASRSRPSPEPDLVHETEITYPVSKTSPPLLSSSLEQRLKALTSASPTVSPMPDEAISKSSAGTLEDRRLARVESFLPIPFVFPDMSAELAAPPRLSEWFSRLTPDAHPAKEPSYTVILQPRAAAQTTVSTEHLPALVQRRVKAHKLEIEPGLDIIPRLGLYTSIVGVSPYWVSTVEKVHESVNISSSSKIPRNAENGDLLQKYDKIFTNDKSTCTIMLHEGMTLELDRESSLQLTHLDYERKIFSVLLVRGRFRARIESGQLLVKTPTAEIEITEGYCDVILSAFNTLVAPRSGHPILFGTHRTRKRIKPGHYGLATFDGHLIQSNAAGAKEDETSRDPMNARRNNREIFEENHPANAFIDEIEDKSPEKPRHGSNIEL